MGHTTAKVRIHGEKGSTEIELLVDTGSTFSWVSGSVLDKLGIKPKEKKMFKTIEGKLVERDVAEAVIEYNKQLVTTIVVFAREKDQEVLGVYALEGLGLEIDPLKKAVKKVEAFLAV